MAARYQPDHVTQADGSKCQWTNCWAAGGAWAAAGATGGQVIVTPMQFRAAARALPVGNQKCRPGGLGDIIRGMRNLRSWRASRYVENMKRTRLARRLRGNPGIMLLLETDFEVWPDGKSCQPGFTDRDDAYHMLGVICGTDHADRVLTMDPLCDAYRWVKVEAVIKAAIRYNNEHAGEAKDTVDAIVVFPPKV